MGCQQERATTAAANDVKPIASRATPLAGKWQVGMYRDVFSCQEAERKGAGG
jgi:hypothetical protein